MNKDFRYPNDNRLNSDANEYSSQNPPSSNQKGPNYYPNDNKGHYSNSNRESISKVDPVNKIHCPNSNVRTGDSLEGPVMPTSLPYDSDQDYMPNTVDQFPFDPGRTSPIPGPSYIASLTPQPFDPNPQPSSPSTPPSTPSTPPSTPSTPSNPDCPSPTPADEPNCREIKLLIQSDTTNNTDPIIDLSLQSLEITNTGPARHETDNNYGSTYAASSVKFGEGDILTVGDTSTFNFIHNQQSEFTIECWVYISAIVRDSIGRRSIGIASNNTVSYSKGFALGFNGDGLYFYISDGDGVTSNSITYVVHSMTDSEILNNWMHVAVSYDRTETKLFLNGIQVSSYGLQHTTSGANSTRPLTIGYKAHAEGSNITMYSMNGYINDFRISQKAVYKECFTPPSQQLSSYALTVADEPTCTEVELSIQSNVDLSASVIPPITDQSLNNHQIAASGNADHSNTQTILATSSLYFNHNENSYLTVGSAGDFNFLHDGTSDFTVELWAYAVGDSPTEWFLNTLRGTSAGVGIQFYVRDSGQLVYQMFAGVQGGIYKAGLSEENVFEFNTWNHVAITFDSTKEQLNIYINGAPTKTLGHQSTYTSVSPSTANSIHALVIGGNANNNTGQAIANLKGYLQDIRISKKVIYTDCFAVPSQLHSIQAVELDQPVCDEVIFNIQSDTTNEADAIEDISVNAHVITKHGDVKHSTDQKIHGASSVYFDGDGDALSTNYADTLNGDFTLETWINLKNIPAESEFTLSSEVASSAIDGELLEITEDTTLVYTDDRISALTSNTITLTSKNGSDFKTNQRLLIITTYGANADTIGNYEFVEIASINGNVLTLKSNIQKTYNVANYTFVVAPQRYNKIIVNENVKVSSVAWSASSDSIQGLVLLSANEIQVKGQISANELGFRGGNIGTTSNKNGGIGESYVSGKWNTRSTNGQYGSGGAGVYYNPAGGGDIGTSGAGAGHGTAGTNGNSWQSSGQAKGGTAFGLNTIKEKIFMGPGGGQGGSDNASPHDSRSARGGYGGRGAGIVIIDAIYCEVSETGIISANGQRGLEAYDPGNGDAGNGGGGAGGSILFTGNIDNEGTIQTTRGDRRVADGSGQSGGYGFTSGYGGHGVIAWFGYNVGNSQVDCLAHSPWKNTSYILDTHSTATTDFGGNKLGLIAIPSKQSGKYDVLYGNFGGKLIRSKSNLTYNEWNHIAVVRKNNIETFYINGFPERTRTNSLDYPNEIIALGSQSFNNFEYPLELNGYLQDFRISKKAVYTTCFAVPSQLHPIPTVEPDHPICDEVVLSIQSNTNNESDQIQDVSLRNHPVTTLGNTHHETYDIYYNDGTDISGWQVRNDSFLSVENGGLKVSSTPTISTSYVARLIDVVPGKKYNVSADIVSSSGGDASIVLDYQAYNGDMSGSPFNSYSPSQADFRVYEQNGKIEFEIQPTQDKIYLAIRAGDSTTAEAIFDNIKVCEQEAILASKSSLYFDGYGDYLSIPNSSDWNIAAGDFTIEFWINFSNYTGASSGHGHGASIIGNATNQGFEGQVGWNIGMTATLLSFNYEDGSTATNWNYNPILTNYDTNRWYHIAVCRDSNVVRTFVNGLPVSEKAFAGYAVSSRNLEIGRRTRSTISGIQDYFHGYLQDIRISQKAVYKSCFTPPSQLHDVFGSIYFPGAIDVEGYYPLFTSEQASNAAGNGSSHTHELSGTTYYMPNGLTLGTNQFHGNFPANYCFENATCDTPNPSVQVTTTYTIIIPGNSSHNQQRSKIIEVPIQANPGKSITYSHSVMASAQTNYNEWAVSNLQLTSPNGSTFTPTIVNEVGFADTISSNGVPMKSYIVSYSVPPIDFSGNWLAADELPALQNDNSVLFDGTQNVNALTNYTPSESEGFSVSMWIKTTDQGEFTFASNNNLRPLVSGEPDWQSYYGSFVFLALSSTYSTAPNAFYLLYKNKNSTARTNKVFGSAASLRDGKWHHVVATIKGTCAKIYIDGGRGVGNNFQQSSWGLLGQPNYTQEMDIPYDGGSNFPYNLGNNGDNLTYGPHNYLYDFKGNKNQVAFFERELSGAEVAAIYNGGIPNDISSLNPTRLFSLSDISSDPDVTYGGATLSSDVPDDPFEYWS